MSSSSCLQSCLLESKHVLRLKLSSRKHNIGGSPSTICDSNSTEEIDTITKINGTDHGMCNNNWSGVLQCLKIKNDRNTKINYTPSQNMRDSSSMLSTKSLEMCTESLGSETGSNDHEISNEFFVSLDPKVNDKLVQETREIRERGLELLGDGQETNRRRVNRSPKSQSFPPPLTSMSGSCNNGGQVIKMKSHREGGRLVLEAKSVSSSCYASFSAERVNGSLTLRLTTPKEFDTSIEEEEEEEEEGEKNGDIDIIEEEEWGEELEDNNEKEGVKNGNYKEKLIEEPCLSWCKEGGGGGGSTTRSSENKELIIWEPFCMAI